MDSRRDCVVWIIKCGWMNKTDLNYATIRKLLCYETQGPTDSDKFFIRTFYFFPAVNLWNMKMDPISRVLWPDKIFRGKKRFFGQKRKDFASSSIAVKIHFETTNLKNDSPTFKTTTKIELNWIEVVEIGLSILLA